MSKLFENGKNMENKMAEILQRCNRLLDLTFEASGYSMTDAIESIGDCNNIESAAKVVGCYANLYKDAKELLMMQAKTMDKLVGDLEELKLSNEILIKQNKEMMYYLHELKDSKRILVKEA